MKQLSSAEIIGKNNTAKSPRKPWRAFDRPRRGRAASGRAKLGQYHSLRGRWTFPDLLTWPPAKIQQQKCKEV